MAGRRQDAVWQHFIRIKGDDKPLRAKCKHCKKEMCSLVARMKTHINKCNVLNKDKSYDQSEEIDIDDITYNEGTKENSKYMDTLYYKIK